LLSVADSLTQSLPRPGAYRPIISRRELRKQLEQIGLDAYTQLCIAFGVSFHETCHWHARPRSSTYHFVERLELSRS
jgi:hypothetical protein